MNVSLDYSYRHCQQLARSTASNFYYAFLLLPREKRRAMCALYAFLRCTDDIGDSPAPTEKRRALLADWRRSLDAALMGQFDSPLFPALADCIARFDIPPRYLHSAIDGMEMDLETKRYSTFEELRSYCYCVASSVGLSCIHIWGFRDPAALVPAEQAGVAFQLTNILRDLKEDAQRDRIYLPLEDLYRFHYSEEELLRGDRNGRFRQLIDFEIERTAALYEASRQLEQWLHPDGIGVFRAMSGIYRALLDEIRRREGDVFSRRVRLSPYRKLWIAARHMAPPMFSRYLPGTASR